jgi:photosystem I P700 chlorophyll a apoprotein A2
LGLALASLGVATSLTAQHMYALTPYAFMSKDFTTEAALYTHQYIAWSFSLTVQSSLYVIMIQLNKDNVLARMLEHKEAIISFKLGFILGFHTLGLYIHNDTVVAFGQPEKQILFEPLFAEYIQAASGKTVYEFNVLLSDSTSQQ